MAMRCTHHVEACGQKKPSLRGHRSSARHAGEPPSELTDFPEEAGTSLCRLASRRTRPPARHDKRAKESEFFQVDSTSCNTGEETKRVNYE
jgi:hypothetical protein